MKEISKNQFSFGAHGSFLLKYSWLPKGFWALEKDPGVFNADDATAQLGVGKNMVKSIRYWLQAAGMIRLQKHQAIATQIGQKILSRRTGYDKYLEYDATLWLLHYILASNRNIATSIHWLFNHFAATVFTTDDACAELHRFIESSFVKVPSMATLKMDVSTILRMYTLQSSEVEGVCESPMASLRLMTFSNGQYVSSPSNREDIPSEVFLYAMSDIFAQNNVSIMSIRDLMYGRDHTNLGSIFRLTEEGLVHHMERVVSEFPKEYSFRESAGIQQVYRLRDDRPVDDYIATCYGQRLQ